MRLATWNSNFAKTGIDSINALLSRRYDMVCLQRFDSQEIKNLTIPTGHDFHFCSSHPHDVALERYGLLTIYPQHLQPKITVLDLGPAVDPFDRYQGTTAACFDYGNHAVINSLVSYPINDDVSIWINQTQTLFAIAERQRSVIVGDFHFEDREKPWHTVDMNGFVNHADTVNAFRNGNGYLMSLSKIFANSSLSVVDVRLAIEPSSRVDWNSTMTHWPIEGHFQL